MKKKAYNDLPNGDDSKAEGEAGFGKQFELSWFHGEFLTSNNVGRAA